MNTPTRHAPVTRDVTRDITHRELQPVTCDVTRDVTRPKSHPVTVVDQDQELTPTHTLRSETTSRARTHAHTRRRAAAREATAPTQSLDRECV